MIYTIVTYADRNTAPDVTLDLVRRCNERAKEGNHEILVNDTKGTRGKILRAWLQNGAFACEVET